MPHLGADQGFVAEVVAAGDDLVPALALAGVAHGGVNAERADLVEGCGRGEERRFGVGTEDHRVVRGVVILAAEGRSARRCARPAWSPGPSFP